MTTRFSIPKIASAFLLIVLLALSAGGPGPVQAAGTITSCTQGALTAALSGGGTVLFGVDCSATPITLSSTITIAATTTIDANGHKVTISGGNAVRLFSISGNYTLTLIGVHITGGASSGANGGAIYVNKSAGLTAINSAFTNSNSMGGNGGAIYNELGTVDITNSTFSGNVTGGTGNRGQGGAIYNSGGSVTFTNSTLSGNVARDGGGGGIYARPQSGGSVTLGTTIRNTILANNQGGNCTVNATSITDGGGNVSFVTGSIDAACPTAVNGSTADPLLGSLSDEFSLTPIFSLQGGSSAINLAIANCPATDQRGIQRSSPKCDSGSYEYRNPTTIAITSSANPSIYGDYVTFTATLNKPDATGTVTFAVDGVPMGLDQPITGGVATADTRLLKAATHTIAATYNGDMAYEVSTIKLDGGQLVNKAPLTIKADDKSKTYGTANPPLTITYTGFKNDENFSVLNPKPSCSTTATTSSPIGDYQITCPGAGSQNYDFTFLPGTLTISPVKVKVIADNATRPYGSANPAKFTYTIINETGVTITTMPTCSTTATVNSLVGNYPITCSGGEVGNPNYIFEYQDGVLNITPIQLTVNIASTSRAYGAPNPVFEYSFSGFVNGEDGTVVTKQPICSTTALPASPAGGKYPINCAGAEAANYTFKYVSGELIINKADLTVKADDKSKAYGSPVPPLTHTVLGLANHETEAVFTSPVTCTTTGKDNSPVSATYPITCTGGVSNNYNFLAYQDGTLTVVKAELTITANNQTRNYRNANPQLTYTITGFVNGETPATSGVTGSPVLDTTATIDSHGGTYPIFARIGTLSAGNYTFNLVHGTLTVVEYDLWLPVVLR